jgi:predicted outer membrane protein
MQQGRPGDAKQEVEQFLAQCLLTKNQGEVEIAQFAAERSQNPQVKQFAQMLIQDHRAAVQRLQGLTGAQASTQPDGNIRPAGFTGQEGRQQTAQPGAVQAGGSTRPSAGGGDAALRELATIERQVAERSQQALREKLQSKQGAEFDQCFVGSQVFGHMQMLATLEVVQQQASGQLRQLAQESHPKVKHHLEQAEQLAEQLTSGANRSTGGQQPQSTQRQ